mgnify:CR=1 FL=1|jgi:FdrA protein
MSAITINEIRKGFYLDSVALMRMSRNIADMEGIEEAAMMMGSPSNRQIMEDAGLLIEYGKEAGGGDLIIGIRAVSQQIADAALAEAKTLLDRPTRSSAGGEAWRPRTLRAALKMKTEANLALISVPGDFAVTEARKAIRGGLHAMIFSDNVSLEQEVQLKQEARELGRLVMGPDCGTAIINGVALAFANQVTRGSIGVIGASGTGTQEVSCLISQYEGGISHAIGVGGRDLKTEVGGISTLMAIDALDADPGTSHLVFVSKPPPASVASIILERIAESKKTATICFLGADVLLMPANAKQVFTLKAAAQHAVGISDDAAAEAPSGITTPNGRNLIHGLFSGGTLCAEAQVILRANNESMKSNAPIPGVPSLTDGGAGHIMIDLGDDEYTQGKPHPMIDPTVRDATIIESINNTTVGVVLVDVVIGFGAHEDPAGYLASVLKANTLEDGPIFIASVTGTEEDPQVRSVQIAKLEAAGVRVASNNADAAEWALAAIRSSG